MDSLLRCNNPHDGYCRKQLRNEAFVTTCSHIFCRDCVQKYGFHDPARGQRRCLACNQYLPQPEDVVHADLRPSEQWQSTILCGLDHATIMECVGKALKFWNYQMTTEIAWQEHLAQEWTTRYTALRAKAGKVIDEANAEIGDLHNQIQALKGEKAEAEKRTADLAERYQAKVKSHNTTQELYDKLKSKVLQEDTRGAAAASAEHTLQSMNAIPRSEAFSQPVNRRTTMPELPSVRKTPHASRYPVDQNGVEQLHPFQRSGSARTSSELAAAARAMAMAPPPQPPPRAAAREPFGRISTASTPGHRVNLPRAHGNHTFPTSAHRPPGSQNYTHSIDRHVPAQERLRYHSQFQGPPDGMGHNVHARMPANRSLY